MTVKTVVLSSFLTGSFLAPVITAQVMRDRDVALRNWPAPLYWQPLAREAEAGSMRPELREPSPKASTPAAALVFVAMTPCRVVDTRNNCTLNPALCMNVQFGPPSLATNTTRSFPLQLSPTCAVPSNAMAYSFNVTMIPNPTGTFAGYVSVWNTTAPPNTPPTAATILDFPSGDIRSNAAIVPAGTNNGSVSVITNATNPLDLAIDINGYYAASTGITLAQGTVSAPSLSFSGDAGTGIFSAGMGSLSLTTGGTAALTLDATGDVELAGSLRKGGALFVHNLGMQNTSIGLGALSRNTTGSNNTASGYAALSSNSTGSNNTALGRSAGYKLTSGDNNLYLGNPGLSVESNTIRIGSGGLDILPAHNKFFVAAVQGVQIDTQDGIPVLIGSKSQLGVTNSSRRFKEDIQDMGEASSGLLRLRPVRFRYRKPYSDGSKPLDYGLIAEEVAEVYPDLIVKDKDGQIQSVQYHKLIPMLLNELQKEHETTQSLQAQLSQLRKELEAVVKE